MKALFFDSFLQIKDIPVPEITSGDVLIRVKWAGICNTDIEITKGYIPNYNGIPGHEFYGLIHEAQDKTLIGKRVTAEINAGCNNCEWCNKGLSRHCPNRTVLGIINQDGAFAEFIKVPLDTLIFIPDSIVDTNAIFIEPLAAALEIIEQITIQKEHKVLLIGDGKLAQLIALVIHYTGCDLTVLGKHTDKLSLLTKQNIKTVHLDSFTPSLYDIIIEASGSSQALMNAISHVKPRGTVVLKSTYTDTSVFNPSAIVVNEITLIGSRCGRFESAINFLQKTQIDLSYLISEKHPFTNIIEAFRSSQKKGVLKVIVEMF
jgi:2-desacetyl-2-hydroxyethyl bacteriochlorophyllide A dehydrogenase